MGDRIKGYVVTLEGDISEYFADKIKNAIEMIAGVADVSSLVSDVDHHIARRQAMNELRKQLRDVIDPL